MKKIILIIFIMFMVLPFSVQAMLIKVQPDGQEIFELEVEDSDTIEFLKSDIESEKGIVAESQKLMFGNLVLEDGRTLADYNIEKGNVISLFYKTELTIMEMVLDDPKVGDKPDSLVDINLYNADRTKKFNFKDFKVEWYLIEENDVDGQKIEISLEEADVFEEGKYFFRISSSSYDELKNELTKNDFYLTSNIGELHVNGKLLEADYFYVGGVRVVDIIVDNYLIVDQEFPTTLKVMLKTDSETKEFIVPVTMWNELSDSNEQSIVVGGVVKKNTKYIPSIDVSNEDLQKYMMTMDFRTEHYISGDSKGYYEIKDTYKVVFDANGGTFNGNGQYIVEEWKNELYTNLVVPTKEGYRFVGYFTEKTGGTKFELIFAESGIDSDRTFYAQWIKAETNPDTSDGIKTCIILLVTSFVSLVSIIVWGRKEFGQI